MGGFLTIGYCFPYCFLEIFVGRQGLDGGEKVVMRDPPVPPLARENPGPCRPYSHCKLEDESM